MRLERWQRFADTVVRSTVLTHVRTAHKSLYSHWRIITRLVIVFIHHQAWKTKRTLLKTAPEAALKYVNRYLRSERYPRIANLSQLSRYCDVPRQSMKKTMEFEHFDECFAWLVNRILKRSLVPSPMSTDRSDIAETVTDEEPDEIASTIDFELTFGFFTNLRVQHLTLLVEVAEGGQIVQLQNRLIDRKVTEMLRAIRLPIELNNPEKDMAEEMLRQVRPEILLRGIGQLISGLGRYVVLDNAWFIDQVIVDFEISNYLEPELPVVNNLLPDQAVQEITIDDRIVTDCMDGILGMSPVNGGTVDLFQITNKMGWANSTDLIAEMLDHAHVHCPVRANVPSAEAIRKIAQRFAPLCNVDIVRIERPPIVDYFRTKDASLYGSLTSEALTAAICLEILWPVDANRIDCDSLADIIADFPMIIDHSLFSTVDTALFQVVRPKDPVIYGNPDDVFDIRTDLLDAMPLPLNANAVTRRQLSEIIDSKFICSVAPFVAQVRNPLESFELGDTHLYTRESVVASVIDSILFEFDPDLPLLLNLMPFGVPEEVVDGLDVCSHPLPYDLRALRAVHPFERRVPLDTEPDAESIFVTAGTPLPVDSNLCSDVALSAILECLDTPAEPLACELPLTDVWSLLAFEAPDEDDVDIEALAQRLLQMILLADVTPFVPVLGDVHGVEFDTVIGDLLSMPGLARMTHGIWGIDKITEISGPVSDRPVLVTAEDVVVRLLWDLLLPEIPVRPRRIEEMIEDELDEIDFANEEEMPELPEELEIMLSYKPKKARTADE
jgi:hypothetical protein